MPANSYDKCIKQYQVTAINTEEPSRLMIKFFDAVVQFLQKARTAIVEKNLTERSVNIDSARKIIRELMRTIDLENGNDVSKRLFKLYNRLVMKLNRANISKNPDLIDEVIKDITNIRWAFSKAIEIQSGISSMEDAMKALSIEI